MNRILWTLQVLWGVFFSFTGFGKVLCFNQAVWNQMLPRVPWFSAVPQALFVFIGVCEFLGGVGLILPAMTGVKPKLTPLAAFGLTLVMILAVVFHILRGEYNFFLPINLVLGGGAAFIAYGRLFVRPIAPASISTFGVLKARGSRRAGLRRFCSGLVPVDTHSLTDGPVSHRRHE
jgi:DoxX-like family